MNIRVQIRLNDGRTNWSDADCDPVTSPTWHPRQYAIGDAMQLAAELLGGTDEDGDQKFKASELNIEATAEGDEPTKWTADYKGEILQNGKVIGHWTGSSLYRFD